jgi:hypothetical protein
VRGKVPLGACNPRPIRLMMLFCWLVER